MAILGLSEIEISVPHCPTHYSPAANGNVLGFLVHQNIRVSDIIVSDILDSYHLPIILHILDHIRIRNLSDPIKNSQIGFGFKASSQN
jgi:hypothetical protein